MHGQREDTVRRGYMRLGDVIRAIRDGRESGARFSIYSTWEDHDAFTSETRVYVADPSDVKDGEEIFPAEIVERQLWIFCADDLLEDVVDNAVAQKPEVTDEEIVEGLEHYLVNDAFMNYITR